MANHKKTETAAKIKKFYSTMSNAVKLAEIQEGIPAYDWDLTPVNNQVYYLNLITNNINYTKREISDDLGLCVDVFYLSDGSIMCTDGLPGSILTSSSGNVRGYEIIYDVNGDKGPNEYGRDWFHFALMANKEFIKEHNANVFDTYPCYDVDINFHSSREDIKNACANSRIGNTEDKCCANLLKIDGWKFKDDYPFKL